METDTSGRAGYHSGMDLTRLLRDAHGDPDARDRAFELAYDELRELARAQLRRRSGGDLTLNTTALVHEAYLKLGADALDQVEERAHFYSLAARAMRQVVVDAFRRRSSAKRGGGMAGIELVEDRIPAEMRGEELLAIDDALTSLADLDPRMARIVEWRFFCGLGVGEIAGLLGVTERTVYTEWQKARAWLGREIEGGA